MPGCTWEPDPTKRFALRQHARTCWTSIVADSETGAWLWDVGFDTRLPHPQKDPHLPVVVRMSGGEIVVDNQNLSITWWDSEEFTETARLRHNRVESVLFSKRDRDGTIFEVRARPVGNAATAEGALEDGDLVSVAMRIPVTFADAMDLLQQHLCAKVCTVTGRDVARIAKSVEAAVPELPAQATSYSTPVVTSDPAGAEPDPDAGAPAVHLPPPLPSTASPHLPPGPPPEPPAAAPRNEPARTLRVSTRLAPDDGEWLSFALLPGTARLLLDGAGLPESFPADRSSGV